MDIKNNITRMLDANNIIYQVFLLPAEKLGAEETAELLNIPVEIVYKSIVVLRVKPGKPILAIIPGDRQVDLKALADVTNEKKVTIPTEHEAEKITELQAGGISPLALINKGFQFIVDSQSETQKEIHISGGQRGINIRISVKDLLKLINARVARISRLESEINQA